MIDPRPPARVKHRDVLAQYRLERLGEPCERCERRTGVHAHHKVFRSQGGNDEPDNLEWLCASCHDGVHSGRLDRYRNG